MEEDEKIDYKLHLHKQLDNLVEMGISVYDLEVANKQAIRSNYILKDKIKERMEQTKKVYNEEMKPYMIEVGNGEKVLNVTGLNKKEKDELINKRNCLLVQIKTYELLLEV